MNCRQAAQYMSPYLDSELGATKTYEVSEHLRTCAACRSRFEAERRIDTSVRERLQQETMPPEMWEQIRHNVRQPAWVRRLRSPVGLATAAGLAFIALVVNYYVTRETPRVIEQTPAIVEALIEASPRAGRFVADKPAEGGSAAEVLASAFGLELVTTDDDSAIMHHPIELVSATERVDAAGRAYLEVKLNCCGQPVLLALAKAGNDLPTVFDDVENGETMLEMGVNVARWRVGSAVAVATSPHTIKAVRNRIRVIAT